MNRMSDKIRVGCLFGSFDPVHMGHLMVADYMVTHVGFSEVWLVVSPKSPHKLNLEQTPFEVRVEMATLAVEDNERIQVSDVERSLPVPSYTIDALNELDQRNQDIEFSLLMGSDNLARFTTWKEWERILDNFGCHVYHRPGHDPDHEIRHSRLVFHEAPQISLSSTYIRNLYADGLSTRYLVPEKVDAFIRIRNLY